MGLAEKRAVEKFKNEQYPLWVSKICQIVGFQVALDVNWEKLCKEGFADSYQEYFDKVYFLPLEQGLKSIAIDQMGKDALKNGLKKVVVTNTKNSYSPNHFTFEGGVLTIDHDPASNVDDVKDRSEMIQKLLEQNF